MKTRYRNTAFLVELMVNILVFSISCAVLVGLFGKAGQLSRQTEAATRATNQLTTMVETLKADGLQRTGEDALPPGSTGTLTYYFDAEWTQAGSATPDGYTITLTVADETTAAGLLRRISGTAGGAGGLLAELDTACYYPATMLGQGLTPA